jgi:hypothetical protein
MSSPSDAARRLAAFGLFLAAMLASAVCIHSIFPITGAGSVAPGRVKGVHDAVARLRQARRPFADATLCQGVRGYLPNQVTLADAAVPVADAPRRDVILCLDGAEDFAAAKVRADREGLTWSRGIDGDRIIAFATGEAAFLSSMRRAGAPVGPADLRPVSPLLHRLRAAAGGGASDDGETWTIPSHPTERLALFGPYADLLPGAYRAALRLRMLTPRCADAAAAPKIRLAVTAEAAKRSLAEKAQVALTRASEDACVLSVERRFTVGTSGATAVETPLWTEGGAPLRLESYALEPVSAAQSR